MKKTILTITIFILTGISLGADSAKLSVAQIVNKANIAAYYQGRDAKARVHMEIVSDSGAKKVRDFIILRKTIVDGGDQKFYVYFNSPADIRRMVFMVHKHVGEDNQDDRWLYLPSMDLVNRIAAGDKRTSFVGSDYFYEDVSGRDLFEDTHKLVSENDKYYIIRNTPKKPSDVEFKYYDLSIDKKTFLPMKIFFYDKKNVLYRKIEVLKVGIIQGHPTALYVLVTNLAAKSKTRMVFSGVKYDIGLPDIFTERYLRVPPRKYLR